MFLGGSRERKKWRRNWNLFYLTIFIRAYYTGQAKRSRPSMCWWEGHFYNANLTGGEGTPLPEALGGLVQCLIGISLSSGLSLARTGALNAHFFKLDPAPPEPAALQSFPISLRVKAKGLTMVSGSVYSEPGLHPSCPLLLFSAPGSLGSNHMGSILWGRVFALPRTALPLDGWCSPVPLLQVWKVILCRRAFLTSLP